MGGSGGGGGSGAVDWPDYLEKTQSQWLTGTDDGSGAGITLDMNDAIDAAHSDNPYDEGYAYAAIDEKSAIDTALVDFYSLVNAISFDWSGMISNSISYFDQIIAAYLVFLEPQPSAVDGIKTNWELPYLPAYEIVRDNWEDLTLEATDKIETNWKDPEPDSPEDIHTDLASATRIAAAVSEFGLNLDDQITAEVLPRFEAGMRDINAVMSSAFVIGRSVIEGMRDRDVSKFQADLWYKSELLKDEKLAESHMLVDKIMADSLKDYNDSSVKSYLQSDELNARNVMEHNKATAQAAMQVDQISAENTLEKNKSIAGAYVAQDKNDLEHVKTSNLIIAEMARHRTTLVWQGADQMYNSQTLKLEYEKALTQSVVEASRIRYVMNKEHVDKYQEYRINKAKWPLEAFQYGANLLAAVSGGTGFSPGATATQSALGGAFAGAAIGARAAGGNMYGTAAGAVLGGIGGYLLGK